MIKEIISNIKELRRPCVAVEKDEDVSQIIQDLKDTLKPRLLKGCGLSANQIGYNKRIAYINVVEQIDPQSMKINSQELVLINPIIIEKAKSFTVKNEGCLSFPGLHVDTDRYLFITLEYENEKRELCTNLFQDYIAVVIQHEVDHLKGRTLLEAKHRSR